MQFDEDIIDEDITKMLHRYNNKRLRSWDPDNLTFMEWEMMNDNKLVDDRKKIGIGIDRVVKGSTHEFDCNPWYVHLINYRNEESLSSDDKLSLRPRHQNFYLVVFWLTWIPPPPSLERKAESIPLCYFVNNYHHTLPEYNDDGTINPESILSELKDLEIMSDKSVGFPVIPVTDRAAHGYEDPEGIIRHGLNNNGNRQGEVKELRDYLEMRGMQELVHKYSYHPLLREKIIYFRGEDGIFWLKDYSYIGMDNRYTVNRIANSLYGKTTTKAWMNKSPEHKYVALQALSKGTEDGDYLPAVVNATISEYGGKKKRRKSLKKKRKTKRRKSLKKKQRKTKRKGRK